MSAPEKPATRPPVPRWKKVTITLASGLLLLGIGLKLVGRPAAPPGGAADERPGPSTVAADPGPPRPEAEGFLPSYPPPARRRAPAAESAPGVPERLSPFFIHGGVSFFAGLALGYTLRAVLKAALVVLGVLLIGLFVLTYAGAIPPVDWAAVEEWVSLRLAEADRQAEGLREHILIHLPSAGLAGAGLVTGFKRN